MTRGRGAHRPGDSEQPEPPRVEAELGELHFANGNSARRVTVPSEADPAEVLRRLGITRPKALLLVVGGADEMDPALGVRLQQLFGRGLVPAAAGCEALILDGGTRTGVMAMIGQGVADRGHRSLLVGVAPEGRVAAPGEATGGQGGPRVELEPNHSHFVLVQGNAWGAETSMLFRLASALATEVPVLVVVVNGGAITKQEVLRAVRRHWPIVVIQGSGRLADEIATALQSHVQPAGDAALAEIVGDGDISLLPMEGAVEDVERLVSRHLGEETVLKLMWQRFARYDVNASREQSTFRRLQLGILALGVASTALILLQAQLELREVVPRPVLAYLLQFLIVVGVASLTVLIAATSRFKSGSKWISLRANAEAIKREIYRYRCRMSPRIERPRGAYEQGLASKLQALSAHLPGDESHVTALRSYKGRLPPPGGAAPGDDGIRPLTPASYLHLRLDDQLGYYRCKIDTLDRQWVVLQWIAIIVGGLGTVLAALNLGLWVALATSIVMAITTYLGYQQSEATITRYQQAATDLENVKAWWCALSMEDQRDYRKFDALVESTELILQGEVSGWVQDMKEVLYRLDARHEQERGGAVGTRGGDEHRC